MTTLADLATVTVPPGTKVDRLGFYCVSTERSSKRGGHMLFVPELATVSGAAAAEMLEERARKGRGDG